MINTTQEEEQYSKNEILSSIFITDNLDLNELSLRIKTLTLFVSSMKPNHSDEDKNGVKMILEQIPTLKLIQDQKTQRNYQIVSNLICTFVDYMKLMAPQIEFEDEIIKFYFNIFIKWLDNFSADIFDIPIKYQLKFDYILDRMAKTNLLSLMINIGMENEIKTVINTLLNIQGAKRYAEITANFINIFSIIKGLLEEVQFLTVSLLNDILMNLLKKKINKEQYKMSLEILSQLKNILSSPINQLIFQMVNNDSNQLNKDTKILEIMKISGDEFTQFIKILCKISHEYLISFLGFFPSNEPIKKIKIKNSLQLDIFISLFSTQHSLFIAKDYSKIFNTFIEAFSNNKILKENDKFKIFKCLLKFLYLNNKSEMKKNNLYLIILEKIRQFFNEIKNEQTATLILDLISDKLFKNKKVPRKVLEFSQIFLDSKIGKLCEHTLIFNFLILKKKVIKSTSLFDLFSQDKKKHLTKISFLFNNLTNRYDKFSNILKVNFDNEIFNLLHSIGDEEIYEKSTILIILFFLTLSDYKANSMFHKYLMNNLDICCLILKMCNSRENNNENSHILLNTEINKRIEESKSKLLKESFFQDNLEHPNHNLKKEILETFSCENQNLRLNKIEKLSETLTNEDILILKKSHTISLDYKEIKSITEFGANLLNSLEIEDTNSKGHEFLQTLLSLIFYNVKFNINHIIINERVEISILEEVLNENSSPNIKYKIDENHMEGFLEILDFLKKIISSKISNKEVINYISVILKLFFELKNEFLNDAVINFILNELSCFLLENFQSSLKYLAMLFFQINKNIIDKSYIFPSHFDYFLFESNHKLNSLKLLNEILKIERKNTKFTDIVLSENFRIFILSDLNEFVDKNYKEKINLIGQEESLKNEIIQIIAFKHEILKYELFLILNEEMNVENKNNFIKKIFNKIYELCNNEETIEENNSEKENKKMMRIFKHINNIEICKFINLIFKLFDYGVTIKPYHQIKLMNLSLFPELFVRDHLLKKIEKCLNSKRNSIYYSLHAIPILTIYFNDPDKNLKKKANYLFAIFLNYLIKKQADYKDYDKTKIKNVVYKYLPEVYLSYILMYFVFNSNLNLLFQSKENKYFESIIISYMRILKKITNNKFDSNFLNQNCMKIKNISLKGKRVSKKISHVTYVDNLIKKDNFSITSDDYEDVKNELCNLTIKIISGQFTTNFKYEDFKPNVPLIFSNENNISHIEINDKTRDDFLNSNLKDVYNNFEEFDLSTIKNLGKISDETTLNNISNITRFNPISSNKAVMDRTLRLEPVSKSQSNSHIENKSDDFDEFENLPYYNKYKNRNEDDEDDQSNIEEKSKEILLDDLNQNQFMSTNKKIFNEKENSIKESVSQDKSIISTTRKRKTNDDVENNPQKKKKKNKK